MKLIIDGLSKTFGKQQVLHDLTYEFEEGKIYGIIGRNGAGKTTLFNCINSELEFEKGKIYVNENGVDRELKFSDLAMVSASPVLPAFLTGYEFIRYFIELNGDAKDKLAENLPDSVDTNDIEAIVSAYFDLVKIDEKDKHKLINNYSFGMKNKIQLLMALIRNPKIILLDEPLSSFDIVVSHDIKETLVAMKSKHIILMTTHIVQLATAISDEIALLKNGRMIKDINENFADDDDYEDHLIKALTEEDINEDKATGGEKSLAAGKISVTSGAAGDKTADDADKKVAADKKAAKYRK